MDNRPSAHNNNALHIGHEIELFMHQQRYSASWLARQLYCDRTNIYKIFKKQSIDTDLLTKISLALNHDFFKHFSSSIDN